MIQAEEIGQVSEVHLLLLSLDSAAVGNDPTAVMEVAFMTCQLMQCTLGGTSVEQPQYYLQKVLTGPSFPSSLLRPIRLGRYLHGIGLSDPEAGGSILF